MSGHFIITGVPLPPAQPAGQSAPSRLEITDLIKIEDQFSLFVQAMAVMQGTDWTQDISHYKISGIHGFPFTTWEGSGDSPANGPPDDTNWNGYCTHGSVLFPAWHRPYVALFEQVMQSHAKDIAKAYPDQSRWEKAATSLRLPFWDWVERPVPPPEVIELATLSILMPSGEKADFPNPLLAYDFKGVEQQFPSVSGEMQDWSTLPQTVRYPGYPNPVQSFKQRLTSTASSRQDNVEHLLFYVKTWEDFSNHTQMGNDTKSSSLEAIHDSIHVLTGGGGHMNDPLVAAFDPIFFMHHCNVDRIYALWQSMNPSVWVSPSTSQEGTWTTTIGSQEDENSLLTPFWNGEGSDAYWSPQGCRSWETLGYTYPDFDGLSTTDAVSLQAAITARMQQKLSPPKPTPGRFQFPLSFLKTKVPAHVLSPKVDAHPAQAALAHNVKPVQVQKPVAPTTSTTVNASSIHTGAGAVEGHGPAVPLAPAGGNHPSNIADASPATIDPSGKHLDLSKGFRDWTARIHFKMFELRESFAVHIFLAEPPENPVEWIGAPGYVGSHYAFVNSDANECANCSDRANTINEGFVHLNTAIAKYSNLHSFEDDVVEPYLKSHLHWRVQKADLIRAIPTEKLSSLQVTILSAQLTMNPFSQVPTQGRVVSHPQITTGRQGGNVQV